MCVSGAVQAEVVQSKSPEGGGHEPCMQSYVNGGVADGGSGEHQSQLRSVTIL